MYNLKHEILHIAIFAIVIFALSIFEHIKVDHTVEKVIKGEMLLGCYFKDGFKYVEPEKVIDFDRGKGEWKFTNGYARNCILFHDRRACEDYKKRNQGKD